MIFGSIAKGTTNYRNDVDILIVSDDIDEDWLHRHQKVYAFSLGKIQSFVFTSDEFRSAIENRQYIIWETLHDGIVLEDDGILELMKTGISRLIEEGVIVKRNDGWTIRRTTGTESKYRKRKDHYWTATSVAQVPRVRGD